MTPQTGMFFAVEGIDSSSRDTQFQRVLAHLTKAGYEVVSFEFTESDRPSAYFVKQYTHGVYGAPEQVGPYTAALFYALDHYAAAAQIRQALDAGKIVVANHFIGANMGYQGAKFNHGEQRLGYFIWLDNMEFELLGIPRPNLNFVLRMPAEIAQSLTGAATGNPYTQVSAAGGSQSLERAVEVYDDLCQLFPKDFSRIDCVRSGKLLDEDTIATLVWEKLHPLLPILAEAPPEDNKPVASEAVSKTSEAPTVIEVSGLLTKQLPVFANKTTTGTATDYIYYVPDTVDGALKDSYRTTMNSLRQLHDTMVERATDYLVQGSGTTDVAAAQQTALQVLASIVPVASLSRVAVAPSNKTALAISLSAAALPEGQNLSIALTSSSADKNFPTSQTVAVTKKALEQLSGNHVESSTAKLELIDSSPRNELSVLPDILYAGTDRSLTELQNEVQAWPYEQKAKLFTDYFAALSGTELQNDPILHGFRYTWDVLSGFQTFLDLPSGQDAPQWQALSPRHGYATPQLIEDAGLGDAYDDCFDMSLQLYSALQAAGHGIEAQYATLRGHKLRYKVTLTAGEIVELLRVGKTWESPEEYRQTAIALYEKIAEIHPLLASVIAKH